ncbi:cation diffusion facilitator family transporter [soil metagenome]
MAIRSGNDQKGRLYREAVQATWIGLGVNLALGVAKLVGGVIGGAFAMVSDAVNSLGDAFTSAVVLLALRVAQVPPDDEHPYGHTRAEAIAGSNVAVLLIVSAILIGWEALRRLPLQHPVPPFGTLWIAGANVVIKESLYHYKIRVGHRLGSSSLIANAWDHRADALSALAVLIGLLLVRVGGPAWIFADELAALVVVGAIVWSATGLLRSSVHELLDVQAKPEIVAEIRRAAEEVEGVRHAEKTWVRKSGLEYLVDIHIQVDPAWTVAEGHRVGHQVKDQLLARFSNLRDVLVHLEPYPHNEVPGESGP